MRIYVTKYFIRNIVIPVHTVTSIKQPPALKYQFFLDLIENSIFF